MPAKLPSSMLRQHAARYAARNMSHGSYRDKRRQIIDGLITMHGDLDPLDATDPLTVLEEAAAKRRADARRRGSLAMSFIALAFAALIGSIAPSAQNSWLHLTGAPAASAERQFMSAFQSSATRLSDKRHWRQGDLAAVHATWGQLDARQRYAARRYQPYEQLLDSANQHITELRDLAAVSSTPEDLVRQSRRIHALLHELRRS